MDLDTMFENSITIKSKGPRSGPRSESRFTDKSFLKELPYSCGCYIFKGSISEESGFNGSKSKDSKDKVLYIGKAKNLRKRVGQYFNIGNLPIKTQRFISLSKSLSYIETDNEAEALILENNLIKKYKP